MIRTSSQSRAYSLVITLLSLGGCGDDKSKTDTLAADQQLALSPAAKEAASKAAPRAATKDVENDELSVLVDKPLSELCSVATAQVFFGYDSAQVQERGTDRIQTLADCLNQPQLANQTIEIVGHADPRGSEAYNDALAMDRALAVKELMRLKGMNADRTKSLSRGESMASQDPDDWSKDRRVRIRLADSPS